MRFRMRGLRFEVIWFLVLDATGHSLTRVARVQVCEPGQSRGRQVTCDATIETCGCVARVVVCCHYASPSSVITHHASSPRPQGFNAQRQLRHSPHFQALINTRRLNNEPFNRFNFTRHAELCEQELPIDVIINEFASHAMPSLHSIQY